jgi:hypothetical protein
VVLTIVLAAVSPVVEFLIVAGGVVGGSAALGGAIGTMCGAFALAAGQRVTWVDWIGIGGGLGSTFGLGVLLVVLVTGNLT